MEKTEAITREDLKKFQDELNQLSQTGKIKVNLKGGVLCPDDIIEYNGQSIPNIHRINISAGCRDVPRLDIFTVMPLTKAEIEIHNTIIHVLKADGATIEEYWAVWEERNRLRIQVKELEFYASDGDS